MRNTVAIVAGLALAGCFAQFEDASVTVTRPICDAATPDCIVGGGVAFSKVQAAGRNTFKVPLGDQSLFKPKTTLGPTTLTTKLLVNQVFLDMTTAGDDFKGVTKFSLVVAPRESTGPGDDPCATASPTCPVLATYDSAQQGQADRHLVLKGSGVDAINLIDQGNHQLIVEILAVGTAPGSLSSPFWGANISVDMSLTARANFP